MRKVLRQLENLQRTIVISYFLFSIGIVLWYDDPHLNGYATVSAIVIIIASWRRKPYNRALRLRRNGGTHTNLEWIELKALYDNRCASCGNPGRLTKDHIIPISRGGTDSIKNIQPLCTRCNSIKGTRIIVY